MSVDPLLRQKVAQIHQDLSKAGFQIQRLKSSIARFKELNKSMTAAASNGNTRTSKFGDLHPRRNGLDKAIQLLLRFYSIAFLDSPRMTPARQSMNFK